MPLSSYEPASACVMTLFTSSRATYESALCNTAGALPATALRTVTFAVGSAVANGVNGHFYEYVSFSGTWLI